MGTLLKNAGYHSNFDYLFYVLDYCKDEDVMINEMFVAHILKLKKLYTRRIEFIVSDFGISLCNVFCFRLVMFPYHTLRSVYFLIIE